MMSDLFDLEDVRDHALLFDGHNMLFRYFNGMPRTIFSRDGLPLHGAYGFVASVLHHVRRFSPTYAIACFDSQGPPERTAVHETYKANRTWDYGAEGDDNPFTQLAPIEAALARLGITCIEQQGVEADDLIATCAEQLRGPNMTIVIASADRDLHQLIDEDVIVYQKRGKDELLWTPAEVQARYGVSPAQLVEWKALVGDVSDNVRGVAGVGGKTASSLLRQYGSLAAVYSDLSALPPRLAGLLEANRGLVDANVGMLRLNRSVKLSTPRLAPLAALPPVSLSVRRVFLDLGLLS